MSIFESIQAAEKKAEGIRARALQEADALVEKTRIESEEKARKLYAGIFGRTKNKCGNRTVRSEES